MNIFLGFILVIGSVLGGFAAMGGHLSVLWQPFELVIIVGAAIGAFIISNPTKVIRETMKSILQMVSGKPYSKKEYLDLFSSA